MDVRNDGKVLNVFTRFLIWCKNNEMCVTLLRFLFFVFPSALRFFVMEGGDQRHMAPSADVERRFPSAWDFSAMSVK